MSLLPKSTIIRQLTQLEADQLWLDSLILRKAEAMHHFAAVSTAVNAEFWSLEDSRLLALLNSDIARSMAILENDSAVNVPVNAGLDLIGLPQFTARAPVTKGRDDIGFADGAFFIIPPTPPPLI